MPCALARSAVVGAILRLSFYRNFHSDEQGGSAASVAVYWRIIPIMLKYLHAAARFPQMFRSPRRSGLRTVTRRTRRPRRPALQLSNLEMCSWEPPKSWGSSRTPEFRMSDAPGSPGDDNSRHPGFST